MGLDGMASARGHRMQGTEHDIAFFLALGCAIALHCIALHCIALYCSVLYCIALHCILTKKKTECSPFFGTVPPIFPPKTVEKQSGMLAFFCISSASKLIVFSSIFVSFSFPWGGSWGVLGLGGSQARILIDFGSILGPLLGPSWLQLRGLGASWGVLTPLGAVFVWSGTLLFPISWPIPFRISCHIDFGSQNDPKIIEKSMKNPCPHEAEKESLFPCLLQRTFKIIWCWSQKGRSSKTIEKHCVFAHFLNINLCQ